MKMVVNNNGGLPDWATSAGFIFVVCVVAFFGGPWVFDYASNFLNAPEASVKMAAEEGTPAKTATPDAVACYIFKENDSAVKFAPKWRGNSDRVRADLVQLRSHVKKLMANCAYDKCEPKQFNDLSGEMGEYLTARRMLTLVYFSQKGASGVDYVNSMFASDDDWQITRFLKAGYEKDELKRLNFDSNASKAVKPVIQSKDNKVGICKSAE
jgi:hypothetical protein